MGKGVSTGVSQRIERLDDRCVIDPNLFGADGEAGAQCMRGCNRVGRVTLEAIGIGLPADVRCDPVQQQIADWIGNEMQIVAAGEIRQLPVETVDRTLQRQHAVLCLLILPLIELRRIESGHTKGAGNHRRLVENVRNLEIGGIRAGDQA